MSAPLFKPQTNAELQVERDKVLEQMRPYTVEMLQRLRMADAISSKEEELLERFESLSWLIEG